MSRDRDDRDGRGDRDDRGEDGFLSRWSRRKRTAGDDPGEAEAAAPETATPETAASTEAEPQAPTGPERTDAEVLAELGLKDPDALEPGDDFAGFMARAVPEHLRRRALRRLWLSNPVLANVDGLNDYDTDFTGDTVAPGMLKTAYQVGRGFVTQIAAPDEGVGEGVDRSAVDAGMAPETGGADPGPGQPTDSIGNQAAGPRDGSAAGSGSETPPPEMVVGSAHRRMRFRFES